MFKPFFKNFVEIKNIKILFYFANFVDLLIENQNCKIWRILHRAKKGDFNKSMSVKKQNKNRTIVGSVFFIN